jgi:hypothetical protein
MAQILMESDSVDACHLGCLTIDRAELPVCCLMVQLIV